MRSIRKDTSLLRNETFWCQRCCSQFFLREIWVNHHISPWISLKQGYVCRNLFFYLPLRMMWTWHHQNSPPCNPEKNGGMLKNQETLALGRSPKRNLNWTIGYRKLQQPTLVEAQMGNFPAIFVWNFQKHSLISWRIPAVGWLLNLICFCPNLPNTSWEGVLSMFWGSKYLLTRCLEAWGWFHLWNLDWIDRLFGENEPLRFTNLALWLILLMAEIRRSPPGMYETL